MKNPDFAKNIAALASHSAIAGKLSATLPGGVQVSATRSGNVTARIGSTLIHSAYDPLKEAQKFAEKIPPGKPVCLYGYGLGYHLAPILERMRSGESLLVIELNADLLAAAMILRDQTSILNHPRLRLIAGDDETEVARAITAHLARMENGPQTDFEVVFHSPSYQVMPKHFPSIANALETLLMGRRFPMVLGGLEEENLHLNRDIVAASPGLNSLKDDFPRRPAVLVSAGPSLDTIHPFLKWLSANTVLACVDTSFPILTGDGIVPDFVFSLDPQEESFRYFVDNLQGPTTLVYTPTASSRVVHGYRGAKVVVFKEGHRLTGDEDEAMRAKGTTQSGGSVSCLGLDCLIQLGCNPVILIGQDCAFSGDRSYSRHANPNDQMLEKLNQGKTLAGSHLEKNQQKKPIRVKCNNGTEVWTNASMYSYLRTIEQIAGANPQTRIYNLCSHGARIENVSSLGSVTELLQVLNSPAPIATS